MSDGKGNVTVEKMPEGMTEICDRLKALAPSVDQCYLEKITCAHRQGNKASSSAKFARNCGHIEAGLYCAGIKVEEISAGGWQRRLGVLPKEYAAKKRAIKEVMARRYPGLKVIEQVADALGILDWALDKK